MKNYMRSSPNPANFFSQIDLIAEVYVYTEMDSLLEEIFWDSISYLGTPYKQSDYEKQVFEDCGSFVRSVHEEHGITIGQYFPGLTYADGSKKKDRGTAAMWRDLKTDDATGKILYENTSKAKNYDINSFDLRPMDVIFYKIALKDDPDYPATHVGMVLGNDRNGNVYCPPLSRHDLEQVLPFLYCSAHLCEH